MGLLSPLKNSTIRHIIIWCV